MRPIRSKAEVVRALLDGTLEKEQDVLRLKVHSTFSRLIEQRKARWANRTLLDKVGDWLTGNTL